MTPTLRWVDISSKCLVMLVFVFIDWQNYLRTQAGNTTTVNVVICTVDYHRKTPDAQTARLSQQHTAVRFAVAEFSMIISKDILIAIYSLLSRKYYFPALKILLADEAVNCQALL